MPRALLLAAVLRSPSRRPRAAATDPWATVNVCDTAKHPDAIGIRASMPGTPQGARLSMRFRVAVPHGGRRLARRARRRLGLASLGTGRGAPAESGWSFTFAHPQARGHAARGRALPLARAATALPRQDEEATEAGHRSSAGADPPGYSAATCTLGS